MAVYAVYKSSTDADQPIGRDAQGVEIYGSDISGQSKPAYYKGVYTGIKHQCVEYARRWLIRNAGITFDQVDNAIDILDLTHARSVKKYSDLYPMVKVLRNPEVGDLVIFNLAESNAYQGHVAVITRVLQDQVQLAEQNYVDRMDTDHTRQIALVDGMLQDDSIAGVIRVQK
jgi:glutathionylspermidine amidase/synthetase